MKIIETFLEYTFIIWFVPMVIYKLMKGK